METIDLSKFLLDPVNEINVRVSKPHKILVESIPVVKKSLTKKTNQAELEAVERLKKSRIKKTTRY